MPEILVGEGPEQLMVPSVPMARQGVAVADDGHVVKFVVPFGPGEYVPKLPSVFPVKVRDVLPNKAKGYRTVRVSVS